MSSPTFVVPGVTDMGNLRPRMKGGRTKEVRATVPLDQPLVEDLDPLSSLSTTSALTTDVCKFCFISQTHNAPLLYDGDIKECKILHKLMIHTFTVFRHSLN